MYSTLFVEISKAAQTRHEIQSQEIAQAIASVDHAAPPKNTMSEPKLLTDKNLQKLVLENPKKQELNLCCLRLSALHRFAICFPAKGQSPWRPVEIWIAKAVFQKTYAKTAIGVEFALRKVL